jgi:hypothetical protein
MSCDGWGVGERCKCTVAFNAVERRANAPDLLTPIYVGDQGMVKEKLHLQPHNHMLYVHWDRLKRVLPVLDEQIRYLGHV